MSAATTFDPFAPTVATPGQATELLNPGPYLGALVGLIDLGTHENSYQGEEKKPQRQIFFIFELEEERSNGSRHLVGQAYNNSTNEKAALRLMIEKSQRIKMTPGEVYPYRSLLGKTFAIEIIHKTSNGRTYHKIGKDGVGPLGRRDVAITDGEQREHFTLSVNQGLDAVKAADLSWVPYLYGRPVLDVLLESEELTATKPRPVPPKPPVEEQTDDIALIEKILGEIAHLPVGHHARDAAVLECRKIIKDARIAFADLGAVAKAEFDADDCPF